MIRTLFLWLIFTTQLFGLTKEYSKTIHTPHGIISFKRSETSIEGVVFDTYTQLSFKSYDQQSFHESINHQAIDQAKTEALVLQKACLKAQARADAHESMQLCINNAKAATQGAVERRLMQKKPAISFLMFGQPLIFSGKMLDNGLINYHPLTMPDARDQCYDWGEFYSDRSDPHLQHIVKSADEKSLQEITNHVKSWCSDQLIAFESHKDIYDDYANALNKKYGYLGKDFGKYRFKPSALYTMFKYQISPWEAVDALNYGDAKMSQSYNPFLREYENKPKTLRVLLNLNSTCKSDVLAVARDNDPLQELDDGPEKLKFNARKQHEESLTRTARKNAMTETQRANDKIELQICTDYFNTFSPERAQELASFDENPLSQSMYEYNKQHGAFGYTIQDNFFYPSALCFLVANNLSPREVKNLITHAKRKPWIHHEGLTVGVHDEKDMSLLVDQGNNRVLTIFKGANLGRELNTIKPEPVPTKEPYIAEALKKQTQEQAISDVQRIAHKLNSFSNATLNQLADDFLYDQENPSPSEWIAPKDLENSESLTFNGWNFLPPALFGMMVCEITPYMATSAIESALCAAASTSTLVATTLAPAITINPTLACVALAGSGALVTYDNAEKIITRVLRATKVLESAITGCMSMVSACVDVLLQPKYFSHGSAYEELAHLKYILIQEQERDAQARTKGLSNEAEPQPQPKPKPERKPKPTAEPEPEPAHPEPEPSPPVPVKSNPPSKTGPIIETTFKEHPSGGQPPPEPPKDDLTKAAASAFGLATFFYKKAFELQTISTGISNSAKTPTVEAREREAEAKSNEPSRSGGEPEDRKKQDDENKQKRTEQVEIVFTEMVYSNKEHILQDKHWWDRLVKDPWNNWDKVTDFIKETMQQGVETFRGHTQEGDKVFMRIAQFDKYEIEVRYRVVGDEIKNITTAMVRLAKGIK